MMIKNVKSLKRMRRLGDGRAGQMAGALAVRLGMGVEIASIRKTFPASCTLKRLGTGMH